MDDTAYFYEIQVAGELDEQWSDWFSGMQVAVEDRQSKVTILSGRVDQAALRGILNRIWDLNLVLLAVNFIDKAG
jgi:hypothetical protein